MSDQNLNKISGYTGANVVRGDVSSGKPDEVVNHKTVKPEPEPWKGFAKASPTFKKISPDPKILASKEAQKEALEKNKLGPSDPKSIVGKTISDLEKEVDELEDESSDESS